MRKFFFVLAMAAGLPLVGCTKSVQKAETDVQRAHDQAVTNIERKQQDLEDTKRDAADRIARKEERALDDAVRADARRHETTTDANRTAPPIDQTAPAPAPTDRRAKVDIHVNPGPGVDVNVNRNP